MRCPLQGEEPAAVDAVMKTEQKEVVDWAVQNDNKPLWTRSPREVRPPFCCKNVDAFSGPHMVSRSLGCSSL